MADLTSYFKKHDLRVSDVMYIYRNEKRTLIHCTDGREYSSLIPVHELNAFLPDADFINIAKGILVCRNRIVNIADDGVYTMADGKTFQGRRRNLSVHKRLRRELRLNIPSAFAPSAPLSLYEKCRLLDNMPLAYCVIELVFDERGHGIDFVFRYCNHEMEIVEGIPVSEMINRSFYEVFKNGDKKWLVTYADVALNGTKRTIYEFSNEINKALTIYCYQPEPGFCSCILIPSESANDIKKHGNKV